jgi:hypothetical protein
MNINTGLQQENALTIHSGAQYMTLQKYFSHPSFIYFFATPPKKLKLRLQIGGRLPP